MVNNLLKVHFNLHIVFYLLSKYYCFRKVLKFQKNLLLREENSKIREIQYGAEISSKTNRKCRK